MPNAIWPWFVITLCSSPMSQFWLLNWRQLSKLTQFQTHLQNLPAKTYFQNPLSKLTLKRRHFQKVTPKVTCKTHLQNPLTKLIYKNYFQKHSENSLSELTSKNSLSKTYFQYVLAKLILKIHLQNALSELIFLSGFQIHSQKNTIQNSALKPVQKQVFTFIQSRYKNSKFVRRWCSSAVSLLHASLHPAVASCTSLIRYRPSKWRWWIIKFLTSVKVIWRLQERMKQSRNQWITN